MPSTVLVVLVVLGFLLILLAVWPGPDRAKDHTPPRCPASRTAAADIVPAGPRPCILYGTGAPGHSGTSDTRPTVRATTKPAAPKNPPAPKAPAAPRVSVPRR